MLDPAHVITWKKQGEAFVGDLTFANGQRGNVVVVGPAENPKGAALVVPVPGEEKPKSLPLSAGLELLSPQSAFDVLALQARAFGAHGLPAPDSYTE